MSAVASTASTGSQTTGTAGRRLAARRARRQQLIDATIESIARRGFSGTTLETVTKGARLSHGVVNFHFRTKEDLYVETLGYLAKEHYEQWRGAMLNAGPDPANQLQAILEADFDRRICSNKKLAVWFAFWGQAKYRPAYLEIHHRFDDERYVEICRLCRELVASGRYEGADAEGIARSIEALVDGLWLNLLMYPRDIRRQTARTDCLVYLATVFPHHFERPAASGCEA
ncbi:MAG: TetR family transcriptional regulator C-terminal domain-containing protein [bacterium]|nr:TetR family transcriptional regulator C-terminal domain-containing protein [bacterium]